MPQSAASEKAVAGLIVDDSDLSFTVRYCKKAAEVTTDGYRVKFGDALYNIVSIDHMNYKKKSLKFKCEKVRR
jgi:SPP1 family predicted phage head-tail adaptor